MDIGSRPPNTRGQRFPETRWSLVLQVQGPDDKEAAEAIEELCRAYWPPIYSYLRGSGRSPHDAEDLCQGFFAHLLAKGPFETVDESKGHLRSFLLAAVKNFVINEHRREAAQKRGGRQATISINGNLAEEHFGADFADPESPDRIFDRRWALSLLTQALERVQAKYEESGQAQQYTILKPFLEWRGAGTTASYAEGSAALGVTENNFKQMVFRLRKTYQSILRQEVRLTVRDDSDVDDELRNLLAALG